MFTVNIKTDNAAFENEDGPHEIARLLSTIWGNLQDGDTFGRIYDINGNDVGEWRWEK